MHTLKSVRNQWHHYCTFSKIQKLMKKTACVQKMYPRNAYNYIKKVLKHIYLRAQNQS